MWFNKIYTLKLSELTATADLWMIKNAIRYEKEIESYDNFISFSDMHLV